MVLITMQFGYMDTSKCKNILNKSWVTYDKQFDYSFLLSCHPLIIGKQVVKDEGGGPQASNTSAFPSTEISTD